MEIAVQKETFDKIVGVLTQLSYQQVAGLLNELQQNARELEETEVEVDGD